MFTTTFIAKESTMQAIHQVGNRAKSGGVVKHILRYRVAEVSALSVTSPVLPDLQLFVKHPTFKDYHNGNALTLTILYVTPYFM
jgi:hypothetical protein